MPEEEAGRRSQHDPDGQRKYLSTRPRMYLTATFVVRKALPVAFPCVP